MLVHGVKGGVWDRSCGAGQHPQHCQHHPQDADDAGEWEDHTIGGGGGYVAEGLVHIYSGCISRINAWENRGLGGYTSYGCAFQGEDPQNG